MIRLSHSTISLFNSCERKFQHRKVLSSPTEYDPSAALINGSAVDAGYAKFLETRSVDRALIETWLSYYPVIEDNVRSITKACLAVEQLIDLTPSNWALASLKDKPATQLSFRINCNKDYYYVGYVDALCVDNVTGELIPVEVKTTSMYGDIEGLYKNSTQALVYSLIIAAHVGKIPEELVYNYMVAVMPRAKGKVPTAEMVTYYKTKQDVLEWLITLKLDMERMDNLKELGFYPKRDSCNAWGRQCEFMGVCDITTNAVEQPVDENVYDYVFDLEDLIAEVVA